ncbi:ABC transporter permease [Alicyclobacillus pomorum]|jgi:ABC-type dipeptide/oligopeptide/nickel transport system permease component|uniref:ABC transporter permease n=1 Tax=Alicyclobacillus pomorum TaxID=204470 RepID=UPI00041FEA9F|nr:ABC transporter permease [Alicyclobacillus pomorum]
MLKYVVRRVLYMVIAFLAVSLVTYFLMKAAPGSFLAFNQFLGGITAASINLGVTQQLMQELVKEYHLNSPWYVQWWSYVWNFLSLHMGASFEYPNTPTLSLIRQTFPISVGLALMSITVATVLSIIAGVVAAVRENTWVDRGTMLVAILGTAIPAYVIAVFLMLVFGVWLHWLPVLGFKGIQYYVLPVLSLALPMIGSMGRYMRNSLMETLHSEYIVTVYAKGGSLKNVVFGHGLRNSLLPLITVVGPQLASLMMGTVFIENMFGIPGMAHLFTTAASMRDYPLIMDSTLLYALVIMGMNLIVDLVYGFLDPRIRKTGYAG